MEDREEEAVEGQDTVTGAEETGEAGDGAVEQECPEAAPCDEEAEGAANSEAEAPAKEAGEEGGEETLDGPSQGPSQGASEDASEDSPEDSSEGSSEDASEAAEGGRVEDVDGADPEEAGDERAEAGLSAAPGAQEDPAPGEEAEGPAEEFSDEEPSEESAQESAQEAAQDAARLKALVEALVFAAGGVVTLNALCKVITDHERADVRRALRALIKEYEENERGFYLEEVAGGFEFRTKPRFSDYVKTLLQAAPRRLSRAALETLAMVAYRQPITRGEIEAIRGVDSGGVLSTLMDRRLIKISGRKNAPGRPAVYSTTREFLEVFDLKDLSCLPGLKEIEAPEEEEEYGSEEQEREEPGTRAGEGSEGDSSGGHHVEAQGRDADTGRPGDGERTEGGTGAEG